MSDTFYKATNDEKMTQTIRDFCDYYASFKLKKLIFLILFKFSVKNLNIV